MQPALERPMLGTFILKRNLPCEASSRTPPLRIAYRITRPSLLSSEHAPLLFIHGGPSLSSEYLNPIADECLLKDRSLIFYDQLGCGWSSIPLQNDWYGVENMASDLNELLKHLNKVHSLNRFHLCGHSLGGAIGYELIRQHLGQNMPRCLSFVLSNATTDFKLSDLERKRLSSHFMKEYDTSMTKDVKDRFFQTHICRTKELPRVLELALTRRGKDWSANDYTASAMNKHYAQCPSALIIRGEYDFVTETCTKGWNDLFRKTVLDVVLKDCAHYPHLEHPDEFAREIHHFCASNE